MHLFRRGSGPPILFIHGMPTSHELWSGVIDQLYGQFTCFAVDLPGLGRTPREPYSADYLQWIAKRIELLRVESGIEKWHVVGHDAGAAVAVHYAHSFQAHVERLVLLSPALFPDLKPYPLLQVLRNRVFGDFLAPVVHSVFWKLVMRRAVQNEEGLTEPFSTAFQKPFAGREGSWLFMRAVRWGNPAEVLAAIPGYLPELKIPTLVVHGLRDAAIPAAFAERACLLLPNGKLVKVDSGHFIPLNRPMFVADNLVQFFAG